MSRSVPTLPEDEQEALRKIRESGDLPLLRQRVLSLRRAKWPLRAIGDPLGAPRSTVRMWEQGANPNGELHSVPQCPRAANNSGERPLRLRLDVPPADRELLKQLATSARKVRGRTPKDSEARKDAERLDARIERYLGRDVPVKRIATHMGVTPRAVTRRVTERYQVNG